MGSYCSCARFRQVKIPATQLNQNEAIEMASNITWAKICPSIRIKLQKNRIFMTCIFSARNQMKCEWNRYFTCICYDQFHTCQIHVELLFVSSFQFSPFLLLVSKCVAVWIRRKRFQDNWSCCFSHFGKRQIKRHTSERERNVSQQYESFIYDAHFVRSKHIAWTKAPTTLVFMTSETHTERRILIITLILP